jgi:hypothetical protein
VPNAKKASYFKERVVCFTMECLGSARGILHFFQLNQVVDVVGKSAFGSKSVPGLCIRGFVSGASLLTV